MARARTASTCRCSSLAGADDAKFAALAERLAAEIGANATLALVEGAGHAAHLEQPDRFLAIVQPWLAATASDGVARGRRSIDARHLDSRTCRATAPAYLRTRHTPPAGLGSGAEPEAGGEEGAGDELDPAGGAEDGDEGGAGGALEDLEHRLAGEDDADEGRRRGRAVEAAGHDRDAARTRPTSMPT